MIPGAAELERIVEAAAREHEVRVLCEVSAAGRRFPVHAIALGSPAAPAAAGFFGGVHGLERIGTEVVLSFLALLLERLPQDAALRGQLERVRLIFVPLVNPAGMWLGTRANANGVDLMRNAPLDSAERVAFLAGGHRLSARLPWYRGPAQAPMEAESRAVCEVATSELLARPFAIALDCHSGFGVRDRIWFPHAHTREPYARIAEVHALAMRFAASQPGHPYVFEPQCRQYLTHGDLWDYLSLRAPGEAVFLPLTLEMGSWRWIRKSPRQAFSRLGIFNPMPADRRSRVRRNHLAWLAYLCEAAATHAQWLPTGVERLRHERAALERWFDAA